MSLPLLQLVLMILIPLLMFVWVFFALASDRIAEYLDTCRQML